MSLSNKKHPHAPGIRPTSRHRERPPQEKRPQDSEIRELATQILDQIRDSGDSIRIVLADQECLLPRKDLIGNDRTNRASHAHWIAARILEIYRMYPDVSVDVDRVLRETARLGTYPNHPAKNPNPGTPIDLQSEWVACHRSLRWDGTTPSEMAESLRRAGVPVR